MEPDAGPPQIDFSRVFDAPRALVYRAFTDPEQLAAWWGPTGSVRPIDEIEVDIRPGGSLRMVEVFPDDPTVRAEVRIVLTEVAEDEVLDGVMHTSGRLPEDFEPFETRFRFSFHDEPDGRTRLEVRQWLPSHLIGPSEEGWRQAFAQLDTLLATSTVDRPSGSSSPSST